MNFINKRRVGKIGEDISSKYLENIGYNILEKNFFCRQGEIDIIAKDDMEYVFIEVKTRHNLYFGKPIEAVNIIKQKHLYKSAQYYLYINKLEKAFTRFDVIEVYNRKNKYILKHWKGVDLKKIF